MMCQCPHPNGYKDPNPPSESYHITPLIPIHNPTPILALPTFPAPIARAVPSAPTHAAIPSPLFSVPLFSVPLVVVVDIRVAPTYVRVLERDRDGGAAHEVVRAQGGRARGSLAQVEQHARAECAVDDAEWPAEEVVQGERHGGCGGREGEGRSQGSHGGG